MKAIPLLNEYLEERNLLLRTVQQLLEIDPQVKAAWLFGSFGRGEADVLSDLDLWVVVDDSLIDNIIAQPRQYAAKAGAPILFIEAPQNAPEGGAYLMSCYDAPTAPHIIDWYWQPLSMAVIPAQVRLLFDHAGLPHQDQPIRFQGGPARQEIVERPMHVISFFWMMHMITAKYLCRSPQAEGMALLPYLIDPLEKTYHLLGREPTASSKNIPPSLSPEGKIQLLVTFAEQMREMMASLAERGEEVPDLIISGAFSYLKLIRLIIEEDER